MSQQLPPAIYPLGLGLLTTSTILFGNLGCSLVGPLPIIREHLGASELSKKDKVRVWALFFKSAGTYIVPGTALTALLHGVAAYLAPTTEIRNLAIASAVASASTIPYTLAVLMPTNTRLLQIDEKSELTTSEESESTELIRGWDSKHRVRYVFFSAGWAAGLLALMNTYAL